MSNQSSFSSSGPHRSRSRRGPAARLLFTVLATGLLPSGAVILAARPAAAQTPPQSVLVSGHGKCLDIHGPDVATNGGKVQIWDCHGGLNQQFRFEGGMLKTAAGKCLDIHGPDVGTNGGKVQIWDCHGGLNQQWSLRGDRLVSAAGKCLDVHGPDATTNGGKVQIWDCHGYANQRWSRFPKLVSSGAGKCLDVHGPDAATNGGKVQVWDCNGNANQRWILAGGRMLNGYGKCLDVDGPNGAAARVWDCNGSAGQTWNRQGDRLVNAAGKCLDVHGPDVATNGGKVQIWDCHGGQNQQWYVHADVHEPLVRWFAPRLRFDSAIHGYPMSAQPFYDQAVAVPQTYRVENLDYSTIANNSVPTYYQTVRCGNQLRIMYWWFYGYQSTCDGVSGAHNGDWERVMVTLTEDGSSIAAVTYDIHGEHYTRLGARSGFSIEEGSHPVVYVGKSSHASFYAQGGSSNTCLPWSEYRNNGNGTHMDAWNNLVDLNGDDEAWLAADRVGGFAWGAGGISTHPTTDGPSCDMNAAAESFEVQTWNHSQCKVGDDDNDGYCVQQCKPGYTQYLLTCTDWSKWSTYSRDTYYYDWTIPTTDLGLTVDDYY